MDFKSEHSLSYAVVAGSPGPSGFRDNMQGGVEVLDEDVFPSLLSEDQPNIAWPHKPALDKVKNDLTEEILRFKTPDTDQYRRAKASVGKPYKWTKLIRNLRMESEGLVTRKFGYLF